MFGLASVASPHPEAGSVDGDSGPGPGAGPSACKSNGTASTAPPVSAPVGASSVSTVVTVTWRPADKTAEFLSAFRPRE